MRMALTTGWVSAVEAPRIGRLETNLTCLVACATPGVAATRTLSETTATTTTTRRMTRRGRLIPTARYARGGEGRVAKTRPSPTSSLWNAGVVDHLPEVIEAATRRAESAEDGVRKPQQRPVLVELAEVAHGVARDVVAECPRAGGAVTSRCAEERVEVSGHALVGDGRLNAAITGAPVAAVDGADVRGLDARQVRFEGDALVIEVERLPSARAGEDDRRRVIGAAVGPNIQIGRAVESGVRIEAT